MGVSGEKYYSYEIIDDNMSDEELKIFINKNNLSLDISNYQEKWFAFAYLYGTQNGFDAYMASSFAYMVSLFLTGREVPSTNQNYFDERQSYINEHQIIYRLMMELTKIKEKELPHKQELKTMFNCIFDLYSYEIGYFLN